MFWVLIRIASPRCDLEKSQKLSLNYPQIHVPSLSVLLDMSFSKVRESTVDPDQTAQSHLINVYLIWNSICIFRVHYIFTWATSWQNQQNDMCVQWRLRSAWASTQSDQSSLSAWRKLGSLATHWAHSEDSDLTGRMPRLMSSLGARSFCWFCREAVYLWMRIWFFSALPVMKLVSRAKIPWCTKCFWQTF